MPEKPLPTSGLPRMRLLFLDGEPVSTPEPRESHPRAAIPADDGTWAGGQSLMAWAPREVEAPARLAFPHWETALHPSESTPVSSVPGTWPELPPAPRAESDEAVVELREWERLRRLDREQRGE
ncbi:hypothetical protein [Myxococcus sp. RHSTA-1-4]|uniref:hypothetical protein n=1 Tax=Myxococcus sp. RHSTA-1-4 TaxID=2874601 RepID=UPI001CBAEED0|nr:hypothetical protein [Myxococcus sp. RHSTA-1-4]MBZ4419326.1 hypothetical protein [Myxococcus sp. RHSTA-1-4]